MNKNTDIVVPTEEVATYRPLVVNLQQTAHTYQVSSSADIERGEELLREIKRFENRFTDEKGLITKPLMKGLSAVRDLFKPLESGLSDAKKIIKEKMLAYTIEQDEIIAAQQAKIESRVEKGTMRADTAAGKLEAIDASKVKSNVRTVVKVRVVDEDSIPRQFMMPNLPLITEGILRHGEVIPGVEKFEEKSIVTR